MYQNLMNYQEYYIFCEEIALEIVKDVVRLGYMKK